MSSLSIPIRKYAFPFCEGKKNSNVLYQSPGHENLTEPVVQKPVTAYVTEDK